MPVTGNPRNYDKKFLFKIKIDGLDVGWFESCSSLEGEIGVVEQHEGGAINVADQSPGKVKHPPVTLSIGVTNNNDLYNWWLQVIDAGANGGQGAGEVDAKYKKNVAVIQLDRDGTEKKRHNLYEAWPSKFVYGEWDAKAEENVMEQITLTFRWPERVNKI